MKDLVDKFQGIGLDEKKATETLKNKKLATKLHDIIEEVRYQQQG